MKRFILDGRYGDLLRYFEIDLEEVLRKAGIPEDLFNRKTPAMTRDEYFRFMDIVGQYVKDPEIPVKMAGMEQIESFSPPIFASYCSKNGLICLERLARYKRLIGPMVMLTDESKGIVSVEYSTENGERDLPQFLVQTEFIFLTGILRKATKETIVPVKAEMITPVKTAAFETFLGVSVQAGGRNVISFCLDDLQQPFVSYNDSMWSYFEPELSKRLSELEVDASMSARVRTALTELLPGGACGIEDVAGKLGISKRTLQRKLSDEETTFQKQLNNTREMLAIHYLRNTEIPTNDIAYLLGYQEINSFLRAFAVWTGKSIGEYKKTLS